MKNILFTVATLLSIPIYAQTGVSVKPSTISRKALNIKLPAIDSSKPIPAVTFTAKAAEPALVDLDAYEELIKKVKQHRKERLVTLDSFLAMSQRPNTIILDTRSDSMYNAKHIKGAIHLNFADFTQFSLNQLIRNPNTTILIYCNNNMNEAPLPITTPRYFVTKAVIPRIAPSGTTPITLALNIPTYINLFGYGYRNIYELSELVSINDARIQFEGTAVKK